jgi:hypothetical protein
MPILIMQKKKKKKINLYIVELPSAYNQLNQTCSLTLSHIPNKLNVKKPPELI